jgi:hypothetical protein
MEDELLKDMLEQAGEGTDKKMSPVPSVSSAAEPKVSCKHNDSLSKFCSSSSISAIYTGIYYFHLQNRSPCPEDGGNRFLRNIDTYLLN